MGLLFDTLANFVCLIWPLRKQPQCGKGFSHQSQGHRVHPAQQLTQGLGGREIPKRAASEERGPMNNRHWQLEDPGKGRGPQHNSLGLAEPRLRIVSKSRFLWQGLRMMFRFLMQLFFRESPRH